MFVKKSTVDFFPELFLLEILFDVPPLYFSANFTMNPLKKSIPGYVNKLYYTQRRGAEKREEK